jgi:hypothetical protein
MHPLEGMGEMREKIYLNLPHLPHLPHRPHLHSRQKDQLLMTTRLLICWSVEDLDTKAPLAVEETSLDITALLN